MNSPPPIVVWFSFSVLKYYFFLYILFTYLFFFVFCFWIYFKFHLFCDGHSLFRLFVSFFLRMFTSPDVPSLTSSWVTDQHVDWRWISYSRWIRPVRMERWRHGQLLNSSGVTRNLQLYATSSGLRSNYCKLWWHWSYFSRFFFSFDQCFLCSFKMAPPARKMNDRFTNSVRVFSVNVWPHRLFFLFFLFFLIGINVQLAESTGWNFKLIRHES